jgi:hypothetical protein
VSKTPRTDAAWKPDGGDGYPTVDVDFVRQLERELNAANERIKQWHNALTPLMPSDFKCWHQNTPNEWPDVAAWVITSQRERITQLESENDALRADLLLWNEKEVRP